MVVCQDFGGESLRGVSHNVIMSRRVEIDARLLSAWMSLAWEQGANFESNQISVNCVRCIFIYVD